MPWKLKERQILMWRPHLQDIDVVPRLPGGYQELTNTEERLPEWVDLLNAVFGGYTVEGIRRGPGSILDAPHWDVGRVRLVGKEGRPVAISVAWEERSLWPRSGHVFWVAVLQGHRGRGLGRYVLTRALQHFAEHDYDDAVLYTEEFRIPAIKLYLGLGFEPLITRTVPDERDRWRRAFDAMNRPDLMSTIREDYDRITRRKQ